MIVVSCIFYVKRGERWSGRSICLQCRDGSLYCGVTKDVEARVATHNVGRGAKYTRSRLPVRLVAVSPDLTKRQAFQFEWYVKRLPAGKKRGAVLRGERAESSCCKRQASE